MGGSATTLRDIAERAGVSISTVSRALNGSLGVKPDVAERIRRIAAEINYTPNLLGRNLRLNIDPDFGPDFSRRQAQNFREKQVIAAAAAQLCTPNAIIALDSGSTVLQLAAYLPQHVVVYTNSLALLQTLSKRQITTYLTGGLYIPEMAAVFGPEAEEYAHTHPTEWYFLSASRIDVHAGLYNVNPLTTGVKKAWIQNARRVALVADHSKFVDSAINAFVPLTVIDVLITDYVPGPYETLIAQQIPHIIQIQRDSNETSARKESS